MLRTLLKRVLTNFHEPRSTTLGSDSYGVEVNPPANQASLDRYEFNLDWGVHTILRLVSSYDFDTVLDVGSGPGEHSRFFRHLGKHVYSVDENADADYIGDFNQLTLDRQFDVVWCSHVLEHQRNVGTFLEKIYAALKDDGIFALTVPCHPRQRLIAGHVTTWNVGLLCYNLVLAGFDCSKAQLLQSFELGCVLRKKKAGSAEIGHYDPARTAAQLERLGRYFPFPVKQGCNAEVLNVNWGDTNYKIPPARVPGKVVIKSKNLVSSLSWF